jgi:hypothetical protein
MIWNPDEPRSLLSLLGDLIRGEKPESLKADEYGRAYRKLEDPADIRKRLKEVKE